MVALLGELDESMMRQVALGIGSIRGAAIALANHPLEVINHLVTSEGTETGKVVLDIMDRSDPLGLKSAFDSTSGDAHEYGPFVPSTRTTPTLLTPSSYPSRNLHGHPCAAFK